MMDCVKIFNTGVTNHSWVYDFMKQYDGYGGVRITWGPGAEIILDDAFFERYPNAAFAVRDFCRKHSLEFTVLVYGFNDSQVLLNEISHRNNRRLQAENLRDSAPWRARRVLGFFGKA